MNHRIIHQPITKRSEITNTKSKSRAEENNSHSIRPSNAIIANEINTQSKNSIRAAPGNQSYTSTMKRGKKHVSWATVIYQESAEPLLTD